MPRLAALASLTSGTTLGPAPEFYYPLTNTSSDPTSSTWQSTYAPASGYTFVANDGIYTSTPITSMKYMFDGTTTFNDSDISSWDVSSVNDMQRTFRNCSAFNQDLSGWNVSSVTTMSMMFDKASVFNQDISGWITSSVTSTFAMFRDASAFNQDIGSWQFSTSFWQINIMFKNASAFNQDIGSWNLYDCTILSSLFEGAIAFNQDISGWDVSGIISMSSMFSNATAFNNGGVALNWGEDTALVNNMFRTFSGATSFNQDISGWNTSSVTNMYETFGNADAFNQDISGWSVDLVTNATNFSYLADQKGTLAANWQEAEHPSNVGLGNFYST